MALKPVVLDTSVILNLLAAGHGEAILRSLQTECLVCTAAVKETLYIRADDPEQLPQPASIDSWIEAKLIAIVAPNGLKEEELYVYFAAQLDDGEAMSLAICHARGYALASDDRKARRIASSVTPESIPMLSTAEIMYLWASRTNISGEDLRRVVRAVERRARFLPSREDPFREWWFSNR